MAKYASSSLGHPVFYRPFVVFHFLVPLVSINNGIPSKAYSALTRGEKGGKGAEVHGNTNVNISRLSLESVQTKYAKQKGVLFSWRVFSVRATGHILEYTRVRVRAICGTRGIAVSKGRD